MINILGFRRVVVLVGLILVNVVFAASVYGYLLPEKQIQDGKKSRLQGEVSTLRSDIDKLKVEFAQIEAQRVEFEDLRDEGFFTDQNRRQAQLILNDIQAKSNIIKAVSQIEGAKFENNADAIKAEYDVLQSPLKIELEALDDLDVYRYLYLMEAFFPGHISIDKLVMVREADVNGTILRSIASGGNPVLVKANAELSWRTMIKDPNAKTRDRQEDGF
ncbi:MAG: hypothetical protein ACPGRX_06395 [Bdellovibrionales bacterium]